MRRASLPALMTIQARDEAGREGEYLGNRRVAEQAGAGRTGGPTRTRPHEGRLLGRHSNVGLRKS